MSDRPAEVWPLAAFLVEEMEARGWRSIDVAMRMGATNVDGLARNLLALDLLLCVQNDGLLVGDRMFGNLARAFDVSEDYFRNLDAAWRNAPPESHVEWKCPETMFDPVSLSVTLEGNERKI
jgi:hypothetical protein